VRTRRKAEDEDTRPGIAEAGYRPSPILLVAVGPTFELRDLCRMLAQSGTKLAIYDLLLENFKQNIT
jgi:hypothetical protein